MLLLSKATKNPIPVPVPNSATAALLNFKEPNLTNPPTDSLSPQEIKIMESKNIQNQQRLIIESKYSSSPSLTASSASSASSTCFDGSAELGGKDHVRCKRTTREHQPPFKKSRKAANPPSLKSLKRVPLGDQTLQSQVLGDQQSYYATPIQVPLQVPLTSLNLNLNSPVYSLQAQFQPPHHQHQLVYSPNIGRMVSIPVSQSSSSSSSIGQQTPIMMFHQIPVIQSPYNQQFIPISVPIQQQQQQQQIPQKSQQLKKQQNSSKNISKSPLTSDVYDYENDDDENGRIGDYEEEDDNDDEDDEDDEDDDGENVEANAISKDDKKINSKLLSGSVSLGSWNSKFSIPLSGDKVEDKKHFDEIMSNAWKSSSSSRK